MAVVVKTSRIPFWDRCTTHFRTYFSGDWDVHGGVTGILTHGHVSVATAGTLRCSTISSRGCGEGERVAHPAGAGLRPRRSVGLFGGRPGWDFAKTRRKTGWAAFFLAQTWGTVAQHLQRDPFAKGNVPSFPQGCLFSSKRENAAKIKAPTLLLFRFFSKWPN